MRLIRHNNKLAVLSFDGPFAIDGEPLPSRFILDGTLYKVDGGVPHPHITWPKGHLDCYDCRHRRIERVPWGTFYEDGMTVENMPLSEWRKRVAPEFPWYLPHGVSVSGDTITADIHGGNFYRVLKTCYPWYWTTPPFDGDYMDVDHATLSEWREILTPEAYFPLYRPHGVIVRNGLITVSPQVQGEELERMIVSCFL